MQTADQATIQRRPAWLGTTALLLLVAAAAMGCPENKPKNGPPQPTAATEHHLFIRDVPSTPGRCIIVDKASLSDIKVRGGDLVIWNNATGHDVHLHFGDVKRLFGVLHAVCYGGAAPLTLRVRDDAAVGRHGYDVPTCGPQEPGPSIVVCPPSPEPCG